MRNTTIIYKIVIERRNPYPWQSKQRTLYGTAKRAVALVQANKETVKFVGRAAYVTFDDCTDEFLKED